MAGNLFKRCGCTDMDASGRRKQRGKKCPKLKRANGSWNPAHGLWAYSLGVTVAGKRKQVSASGFESQADAQAALDAIRGKQARGIQITDRSTVEQYLRDWLDTKRGGIRPTTQRIYDNQTKYYLVPHLGHHRLDELRPAHVAAMLKAGQAKGLSKSSVGGMRRVLRAALNDAIAEGLIATNAAALAKMPAMEAAKKAMVWTDKRVAEWELTDEKPGPVMVWTPKHLGTFLDAVADHELYALFHLLAFRGLRRGEVCALEWDDFDWEAKTVSITRQLITGLGKRIEGRPKSDAGSRTISLDAGTIEVLKRHRHASISTPPIAGHEKKIFRTKRGYTLDPNKVTRTFLRLADEAGLPPIRLHDLRHGAASLLHASGADMKTIQETLGHSTLVLTANTYTSLFPEIAHEAAERAAAIVPRAGR